MTRRRLIFVFQYVFLCVFTYLHVTDFFDYPPVVGRGIDVELLMNYMFLPSYWFLLAIQAWQIDKIAIKRESE